MTYFWINDRHEGPFDDHTVERMLVERTITSDTLVWKEGLADWVPLKTIMARPSETQTKLRLRIPGARSPHGESAAPSHCADMRTDGPPESGLPDEQGLLQALDTLSDQVTSADPAGPEGQVVAEEFGPLMTDLYRWPQFGPDLGLVPPGAEPDQRTVENGTLIPRDEFVKLLRKAIHGDFRAQFDLADIYFENAGIEPDPSRAALLRAKGDEYFALGIAGKFTSPEKRQISNGSALPADGDSAQQ